MKQKITVLLEVKKSSIQWGSNNGDILNGTLLYNEVLLEVTKHQYSGVPTIVTYLMEAHCITRLC